MLFPFHYWNIKLRISPSMILTILIKVVVNIYSEGNFDVDGTMPRGSFKAKGFNFEAGVRSRGNKAYLSSIVVSDQKFIKVNPAKPADNSPDLRVNVNNPFKGKRFSENDILFLDRNRLFRPGQEVSIQLDLID